MCSNIVQQKIILRCSKQFCTLKVLAQRLFWRKQSYLFLCFAETRTISSFYLTSLSHAERVLYHVTYIVGQGWGRLSQFIQFRYFPSFLETSKHLVNVTFIFDRCYRSWAAVAPVKYECGTFARLKICLIETTTNWALVTPTSVVTGGLAQAMVYMVNENPPHLDVVDRYLGKWGIKRFQTNLRLWNCFIPHESQMSGSPIK